MLNTHTKHNKNNINSIDSHLLKDLIGYIANLYVIKITQYGIYLAKTKDTIYNSNVSVLLPNVYLMGNENIGDEIKVFIYTDSQDRIIATTNMPLASINSIAILKVKDKNKNGLFLDMGLAKDIFMPTKYPNKYPLNTDIVVRITRDKEYRLIAKKDINPLLKPCKNKSILHHKVNIYTISESNLGFLCVVMPYYYQGMIYHNTLQTKLTLFKSYFAKVVKIRHDGKLDLILQRDTKGLLDLIKKLNKNNEYFCINDENAKILCISKKGLKKEISLLIKQNKVIFVKDNGYCTIDSKLVKY